MTRLVSSQPLFQTAKRFFLVCLGSLLLGACSPGPEDPGPSPPPPPPPETTGSITLRITDINAREVAGRFELNVTGFRARCQGPQSAESSAPRGGENEVTLTFGQLALGNYQITVDALDAQDTPVARYKGTAATNTSLTASSNEFLSLQQPLTGNARLQGNYYLAASVRSGEFAIPPNVASVHVNGISFDGVGAAVFNNTPPGFSFSESQAGIQFSPAPTQSLNYSVDSSGGFRMGPNDNLLEGQLSSDNSSVTGIFDTGRFLVVRPASPLPTVASVARSYNVRALLSGDTRSAANGSVTLNSDGTMNGSFQDDGTLLTNQANLTGLYSVDSTGVLIGTLSVADQLTGQSANGDFRGVVGTPFTLLAVQLQGSRLTTFLLELE